MASERAPELSQWTQRYRSNEFIAVLRKRAGVCPVADKLGRVAAEENLPLAGRSGKFL